MSIKRTGRLKGYGWKTYVVDGREQIRMEYRGVELCFVTGFPDNEGNDVCTVQIVHPKNVEIHENIQAPQRREFILRIPPKAHALEVIESHMQKSSKKK